MSVFFLFFYLNLNISFINCVSNYTLKKHNNYNNWYNSNKISWNQPKKNKRIYDSILNEKEGEEKGWEEVKRKKTVNLEKIAFPFCSMRTVLVKSWTRWTYSFLGGKIKVKKNGTVIFLLVY